ncbi:hypothetical protein [Komagataeibacter swingsii]|uniref:Uncharacterized protein n=1 Tax=Komagataeibacter swingsii TaxID=215220 RepID=A0A2V4R5L2_9PROT|nr:hypothetical protein [Komagataeibacter swingsii]PYD71403.1 hypothetical protein CFR76_01675 [Komagataeibacter swingsii]GBQ63192.1 hypothetical protein AA16373_2629 [Komagataeibacter swingsii DSM 16373]
MLRFRSDMEKWQTGACQLTNFFVHVQGGASNRPGTQYIGAVKDAANLPRLVPFVYNNTQSYVLEMGDKYFRFISNGAYLTNTDGSVYEVATPYAVADVWGIRWVQSADVLTIAHPSYPLYNLSRSGETDWTLAEVSFAAGIEAPGTVSATATNGNAGNTGTTPGISSATYDYVVTAVSIALNSESNVSAVATVKNYNIGYYTQYGNYNTVNWSEVSGADYYNIYCKYAGSYGLIGSTTDLSFQDTDYEPDTAIGPPTHEDPFSDGNNPSCVSYFQQRRVFGGSTADPQTIWMTRSGNYTNMDVANPVKDDDAITATIASQQVNQIKHIVPMADLIIFTAGSVWKVSGGDAGKAITPADVTVTPQMFVGAADTLPLPIDQDVLFVESKGNQTPRILTNDQVQALSQQISRADPAKEDIGQTMDGIARQYGQQWPKAFGELVQYGKLPPDYQVLANMDTADQTMGRADFQRALQAGTLPQLQEAAGQAASNILPKGGDDPVEDQLAAFRATTVNSSGGDALYRTVHDATKRLALYYIAHGQDSSTALTNAVDGVINSKYDISGSMRVPKGMLPAARTAAASVLSSLRPSDLAPIPGSAPGLTDQDRKDFGISAARAGGQWVQQGGGAWIYGDFLFGEQSRMGNSFLEALAGPTFSDASSLFKMFANSRDMALGSADAPKGKTFEMNLLQEARRELPFGNLFYTRAALDYLVFYRLQEMMNPGYLRRYELGIQQNQGQKFWLSPTWNPYQAMAGR